MKINLIAGARPNFIKIAPIIDELDLAIRNGKKITYKLIHTGQHYDEKMSSLFFTQLNIRKPDINLGAGGGSQAQQTAAIMTAFENELLINPVDLVLVVGDVTSTMACSIVAKKLKTKVAHVEAGIRSGDMSMPEEINRIVTDSICDYFFTTTRNASQNLINSGVGDDKVFFAGNVMIDTLRKNEHKFIKPSFWKDLKLENHKYIVMTLHRPANVDDPSQLKSLIDEIVSSSRGLPIIFPIHPRTAVYFFEAGIAYPNLHIVDPQGYLEFNYLVKNAKVVVTDSGGITEETTVMGVPCITLRDNTERPETVSVGTNVLIGTTTKFIKSTFDKLFDDKWKNGNIPELWDGLASKRIVKKIIEIYGL